MIYSYNGKSSFMWNDHWSIMKTAYFIILFSFNINFRFSIKWCSRAQKVIQHNYVKYTYCMETVQQNGRFTLFLVNSTLYMYILFSLVKTAYYPFGPKFVEATHMTPGTIYICKLLQNKYVIFQPWSHAFCIVSTPITLLIFE